MVKYCNASCKKKHRHKHKKDCEEHLRRAAEHAAELHDQKLFKQPPPEFGDCPICFLPLPILSGGRDYYACCGKVICSGCTHAPVYDNQGNKVVEKSCPFCRTPYPSSEEEMVKRYKKRVEMNDHIAISDLGSYYRDGLHGFPRDYVKALELFHRAVELGYSKAYNGIGYAYNNGEGVEVDIKKAIHYFELAAMGGDATARYNLGVKEENAGNTERALRHYMIAIRSGYAYSLNNIKQMYTNGHATKDDYTTALQSYQAYLGEIKSAQRDEAALYDSDRFRRYY